MRCPNCQAENPNTSLKCSACGKALEVEIKGSTTTTSLLREETSPAFPKRRWGTARFDVETRLVLTVQEYETKPIFVDLSFDRVIGRTHNDYHPDIDMTPFNGYERGVSRQHALLRLQDDTVVLIDLNSANHTFLNGQRLVADQSRIVRDGDEIRLGQLVMRVSFEDFIKPAPEEPAQKSEEK